MSNRSRNILIVGAARILLWIVPTSLYLIALGVLFHFVALWTDNPALAALADATIDPCLAVVKFAFRVLGIAVLSVLLGSSMLIAVALISQRLGSRGNLPTISLDRMGENDSPEVRKAFDQMHLLDDDDELPPSAIMMRNRVGFAEARPRLPER